MTRIICVGLLLALLCAMFADSASAQVLYGSIVSSLRTNAAGAFTGGVFEITGTANTGRDGLVQRAFRLGLRLGF